LTHSQKTPAPIQQTTCWRQVNMQIVSCGGNLILNSDT
jgi:hypothetical protein